MSDSREQAMLNAQRSIAKSLTDMVKLMTVFNENLVTAMGQFKTWLEVDDSNWEIDYVEQLPDGTKRYFFKEVPADEQEDPNAT